MVATLVKISANPKSVASAMVSKNQISCFSPLFNNPAVQACVHTILYGYLAVDYNPIQPQRAMPRFRKAFIRAEARRVNYQHIRVKPFRNRPRQSPMHFAALPVSLRIVSSTGRCCCSCKKPSCRYRWRASRIPAACRPHSGRHHNPMSRCPAQCSRPAGAVNASRSGVCSGRLYSDITQAYASRASKSSRKVRLSRPLAALSVWFYQSPRRLPPV